MALKLFKGPELEVKKEPGPTGGKIVFEQTSPPQKSEKVAKVLVKKAGKELGKIVESSTLPFDKTAYMEDWTDDQWDNLQMQSLTILKMIANPAVNNKAWRAKLKIALDTIAGYRK